MKRKILSLLLSLTLVFSLTSIQSVGSLAAEVPDYLCLTSNGDNEVSFEDFTHIDFEYSRDGGDTWSNADADTRIKMSDGDKVWFKADQADKELYKTHPIQFNMEGTGTISATGNIMSLAGNAKECPDYCFSYLFAGCDILDNAPELPAMKLGKFCYMCMFAGCTSLTEAPALPATELNDSCYANMFSGCKNLLIAPDLPAKVMFPTCYSAMFSECKSLVNAPKIDAETLANNCFAYMFGDCSSLTNAPELDCKELADYCYTMMFSGCTSLTEAPALPAEKLAQSCYSGMFGGCTALTDPPVLPAKTLALACYSYMFDRCTALADLPVLPAKTLPTACCLGMFEGCSFIKLSTDPDEYDCCREYRIPESGEGTAEIIEGEQDIFPTRDMFAMTSGSFTGTPDINTTYYLPHKLTKHDAVSATCEKTGLIEYWSCDKCGKMYADPAGSQIIENYEDLIVPPSEHLHSYSKDWSTNAASHWHAAICEHKDLVSDFGAHNFDEGKISKGIKTVTCQTCSYVKSEKLKVAVPKTTLRSLKKAKKAFKVKWTKQKVNGYQLRYSTSAKFKTQKTVTVKKASTVSKKIRRLKSKKKYYVQVRCYISKYDKTYYSGWTSKKAVTTR